MIEDVKTALQQAVKATLGSEVEVEVTRPESGFGDFATNTALKLAKEQGKNPKEIAQSIVKNLQKAKPKWLESASVAGPGFINVKVTDECLVSVIDAINKLGDDFGKTDHNKGQDVIVEYLDPNPFKEIHIGHAYTGTVGDAIATLFETSGAKVHRVTYQGDVGLHIAKAIYGILKRIDKNPSKLKEIPENERPKFLGEAYADGAAEFEKSKGAKEQIFELNKKIYDQSDPLVNKIHKIGLDWSMKYFDEVYEAFGFTVFEKNYLEGMVAHEGQKLVEEHIADGVFEKSQGAVIFRGEKHGLHTRVFVNSQGLPTYEAKDLGNAMLKWRDYKFDKSIIITAEEQAEYFKVMLKALEQFAPEQAESITHISHGMVKLSTGKMSSRTGQVERAIDLLKSIKSAAYDKAKKSKLEKTTDEYTDVALAAIKYAFLKNRIGQDVVYDVDESLNLEGNSGPYLQYAHARACSILTKSTKKPANLKDLNDKERNLANKLSEYQEVVQAATKQLAPHVIATYLFELAQDFNRFYETNRIIGDEREACRLSLVKAYATILKNGLFILRIPAPERM
jgi:arginyl-tRNA synthetase